jgi:hypothetical protein
MKHSGQSNPQGIIVAGEAPESDEEHEEGEQRYSILISSDKFQKCAEKLIKKLLDINVSTEYTSNDLYMKFIFL